MEKDTTPYKKKMTVCLFGAKPNSSNFQAPTVMRVFPGSNDTPSPSGRFYLHLLLKINIQQVTS